MLRRPGDMKEWQKDTVEEPVKAEEMVIVEDTEAPVEADAEVVEVKAEEKPKAVKKAPAKRRTKKPE